MVAIKKFAKIQLMFCCEKQPGEWQKPFFHEFNKVKTSNTAVLPIMVVSTRKETVFTIFLPLDSTVGFRQMNLCFKRHLYEQYNLSLRYC